MPESESPIFSKSYDMILWITRHVEKFPKRERFRLAKRIEDASFSIYDYLLHVIRLDNPGALRLADLELDKLRLLFRVSVAKGLTSTRQYAYISRNLSEIGRLLGGWIKKNELEGGCL